MNNSPRIFSFAKGYLIDELYKPGDLAFTSFWMYKNTNGKLGYGPMWDYDISGEKVISIRFEMKNESDCTSVVIVRDAEGSVSSSNNKLCL